MSEYSCPDCLGHGLLYSTKEKPLPYGTNYIRCWRCVGNGLDPVKFFNFTTQTTEDTNKNFTFNPNQNIIEF